MQLVACLLFGACYFTRRRRFSVLRPRKYRSILDDESVTSENGLLSGDSDSSSRESSDREDSGSEYISTLKNPRKQRSCCGVPVTTPNTARFKDNWHSRVLYKFPFLLEMFYWVLTYIIYRFTHIFAQAYFSKSIWDVAQENGLRILAFEQFSPFRFAFPVLEIEVQNWFLNNHPLFLTVLNKFYALIHIPGTVYFVGWYYYAAPTHAKFAVVRRTMTLCNLLAFVVFTMYPCMPPRLLPKEYGFVDTVRQDSAESVWMSGKFVNHLAAMPSMHFGYSFMIGVTCMYHAGAFRWLGFGYENKSPKAMKIALALFGAAYPLALLTTIVATANHVSFLLSR